MNQPEATQTLSAEVFQLWERQADASGEEWGDEWREYAMMMAAFQEALARAPRTLDACERTEIAHLLITELEHLADVVYAIFPCGGIMEFASYLTTTTYGPPSSRR